MRALVAIACLTLPAVAAAEPERCGGFETLGLWPKPLPLLGGRLGVRALAGAALKDRPGSIMGPDADVMTESRVWLEGAKSNKKARFVIAVHELFRRPVKDLAAVAAAQRPEVTVEPWSAGPLGGVAIVPRKLEPVGEDKDAILVFGVLVSSPDDTLQSVDFYVSPEVGREPTGCTAVARRIAATLLPGDRKLATGGGKRDLGDGISIKLDAGQVMTVSRGPDFDVTYVQPMLPFGRRAVLGVYLGHAPGMDHDPGAKQVAATLFGTKVTLEETVTGAVTTRQAIIPVPGNKSGLVSHVFYSADDPATLAALARVAESLEAK